MRRLGKWEERRTFKQNPDGTFTEYITHKKKHPFLYAFVILFAVAFLITYWEVSLLLFGLYLFGVSFWYIRRNGQQKS